MGEEGKVNAAIKFVESFGELVESSKILGVGTGSTVAKVLDELDKKGLLNDKLLVSTSLDSMFKLRDKGFKVTDASSVVEVDIYFDGADEADSFGNLVKGRGAALFGEKIIAYKSKVNVFVVDESKIVNVLGTKRPVPVEVHSWSVSTVEHLLAKKGYRVELRRSKGKDGPVVSDFGGIILDVYTGPIEDPSGLHTELKNIPGVLETGLFIGYTDYIVVGWDKGGGEVRSYRRTTGYHYG